MAAKEQTIATEYIRPRYFSIKPQDIYEMGIASQDRLATALLFLTYITGARIGEAVRVRYMNISVVGDFYEIIMPVQKKRKMKNQRRRVPIPRGKKAKCFENEMMKAVVSYLTSNKNVEYPLWKWGKPNDMYPKGRAYEMDVYLRRQFAFTTNAFVKTKKYGWMDQVITKPLHPHFLRHCRADHLVQYYNFTDTKLRHFFSWTSTQMAAEYTQIQDLTDAFG